MFAIAVELLGGRYVATAYNNRNAAEWPPHPARLFSALVAAWASRRDGPDSEAEAAALQWLERQNAPEILASGTSRASPRSVVPVFVPVNDVHVVSPPDRTRLDAAIEAAARSKGAAKSEQQVNKLEQKLLDDTAKAIAAPTRFGKEDVAGKLLPERRTRQPRTFPSVQPEVPSAVFCWRDVAIPSAVEPALRALLARLVRLGHSSSLVHVRLASQSEIEAVRARVDTFVPDDDDGTLVLRWVSAGQFERLEHAFELHRETEPRVLPATFVRYRQGERTSRAALPTSAFDDELIVFARVGGPRMDTRAVAAVTQQLRRALMSVAQEPVPEILTGHAPSGGPSETGHVAITALPFVGHAHADGTLLGLALMLPRHADGDARRAVLAAVGRLEEINAHAAAPGEVPTIPLKLGRAGVLELQRVAWGEPSRVMLRSSTWCRPSRWWLSATPVALDHNPGDLHDPDPARRARAFDEATATVSKSVERIGLPSPRGIEVLRSCVLPGSVKPRSHPRFPLDPSKPQRVLVHVRLSFSEPVRGPIVIGAGRYQGLGLCLPVATAGADVEIATR